MKRAWPHSTIIIATASPGTTWHATSGEDEIDQTDDERRT